MIRSATLTGALLALLPFVFLNGCSCSGPGLGNCPDEVCNGVDDDCDGETDEGEDWGTKGETCFVGLGACQAAGVFICDERDRTGPLVCSGTPGSGANEICNGVDDNCDGSTDEEPQWSNLNDVCRVQQGGCVGVGIFVCDPLDSVGSTICDAVAGPPVDELCNGFDDDCDGQTDEGVDWADLGSFCSSGVGACARPGLMTCDPADDVGPTLCNAQPGSTGGEVCNGIDDDCDGETDEGVSWADKGDVCTSGLGICETPGIRLCDPADPTGPTICSASQGTLGSAETCNGLDDDCDGQTDEDAAWADKGSLCSQGLGACQRTGVLVCNPTDPTAPTFCNAVAGTPGSEVCDRVDNDCDGQTDEEAAWTDLGAICREGSGTCENVGVMVCDTTTPSGPTVCSVGPGAGNTEVCNRIDDDCDGQTDEGPVWTDIGQGCLNGEGVCAQPGVRVCDTGDPTGPTVCSATPGTSTPEVCNDLDDDCDGQTDEGSWADKGAACSEGQGICLAAGVRLCDAASPSGPTVCSATAGIPGSEICNGLDDDCDGSPDDGLSAPPCLTQDGVCSGSVQTCSGPFGWQACSGGEYGSDYEPVELSCDALDNNCDGSTDLGLPAQPCANQSGVCAGSFTSCGGGTWQSCGATEYGAGYQVSETTCDAMDNDCDGTTDEGWLNGATGKYDLDQACGSCFIDCTVVFDRPNAWGGCDASGIPQCQMNCCTVGDGHAACDGTNDYLDLDGVPANGCEFRVDASVVFVSTPANGGADSGTCGGQASPCATITQGLARAAAQGSKNRVHVSSGAYYESVTLIAGESLYGGYNPVNWGHDPAANTTAVYGNSGAGHRKAVIANGITTGTAFDGFVIYGENASAAGENSYGIWIRNSSSALVVSNNTVWSGNGAPGTDGAGGSNGGSAGDGGDGLAAYDTGSLQCVENCVAGMENLGGAGGAGSCPGLDVSGGDGGTADCPDHDELAGNCLASGCPALNPVQTTTTSGVGGPNGGGAGGIGGCDSHVDYLCNGDCSCYVPPAATCAQGNTAQAGVPGSNGVQGTGGGACSAPSGSVSGDEWINVGGGGGGTGNHGRGGGGGGAGGGVETWGTATCAGDGESDIGGSGGGGGGGGCAGAGGSGGASGSGSFAIFVVFTSPPATAPVITGCDLNPGEGGRGGAGGFGGVAGAGGLPGEGGDGGLASSTAWCAEPGFPGGSGGDGGHGGGGGGGCGGASYGIYASGQGGLSLAVWNGANAFNLTGVGGAGGVGGGTGAGGSPGSAGSAGASTSTNF